MDGLEDLEQVFPGAELVPEIKNKNSAEQPETAGNSITGPLKAFANYYLNQQRWSVIPITLAKAALEDGKVKKNFIPLGNWKKQQESLISIDDPLWDKANGVAVITGKISNLTVIDFDTQDNPEMAKLPETYTVKTSKGFHFYYKFNAQVISNSGKLINGVDFKSEGGLVFAPPSRYELPDGNEAGYEVVKDLPLADFPIAWYNSHKKPVVEDLFKPAVWKENVTHETAVGSRNDTFASIIGGLIKGLAIDDFETVGWTMVQSHNKINNKPPLSTQELRLIFNSITSREKKQRSTDSAIKDFQIEAIDEGYLITVYLENAKVKVKFRNIILGTGEAHSLLWMEKAHGITQELNFRVKLNSDTNKEQWARLLSKAFDKKDNKETYPWTILVSEITSLFAQQLGNVKQDFSLSEIEDVPFNWILEPFIQEGSINLLFGLGSSGKTLLANYFSVLIATKQKILDKPSLYCPILFIDYENTASQWRNGIYNLLGETSIDILEVEKSFFYWDSGQIPLYEQTDKLRIFIKKNNIGLVIVDSASMASGNSTSDEESAIRLMATLKTLKTTALIIAHQRKNDGDRTPIGSIQYENQARNVWNVSSLGDIAESNILHIACKHTKANNTFLRKNPIGFKVIFAPDQIKVETEAAADNFPEKVGLPEKIKIALFQSPQTIDELIDSLGLENTKKQKAYLTTCLNRLKTAKKTRKDEKTGAWSLIS